MPTCVPKKQKWVASSFFLLDSSSIDPMMTRAAAPRIGVVVMLMVNHIIINGRRRCRCSLLLLPGFFPAWRTLLLSSSPVFEPIFLLLAMVPGASRGAARPARSQQPSVWCSRSLSAPAAAAATAGRCGAVACLRRCLVVQHYYNTSVLAPRPAAVAPANSQVRADA